MGNPRWSGSSESNRHLQPWKGCALPLDQARVNEKAPPVRARLFGVVALSYGGSVGLFVRAVKRLQDLFDLGIFLPPSLALT